MPLCWMFSGLGKESQSSVTYSQSEKEAESHPLGLLALQSAGHSEVAIELRQCEEYPAAKPDNHIGWGVNRANQEYVKDAGTASRPRNTWG